MALWKSKDVPKDAVTMTELEATSYIWDIVSKWDTFSDTWALRYSPAILGSINAISGIIINQHYRNKLKLGNYGYLSSVIPISVMPGMLTALFHRHTISTGMLLMKNDACPVCYEVKSAVVQFGFGIVYPMILAPTSGLMFAHRYSTSRIPSLGEGPKAVFQFLKKISKSLSGTLVFLGTFQFVASSVLTYFEMRNNFTLKTKIIEIENKVMAEHGIDRDE